MGLLDELSNLMGGARPAAEVEKDKQEAKAEAAKLDVNGLKELIVKVTGMITSKNGELAGLQEKLKGLSALDLLGSKGGDLKDQAAKLLSMISSLKTKLDVYQEEAKNKQA